MKEKDIIKERPSKYVLRYGKSLKQIANLFGVSLVTIHNWFKNPKKKKWLEQKLKERE